MQFNRTVDNRSVYLSFCCAFNRISSSVRAFPSLSGSVRSLSCKSCASSAHHFLSFSLSLSLSLSLVSSNKHPLAISRTAPHHSTLHILTHSIFPHQASLLSTIVSHVGRQFDRQRLVSVGRSDQTSIQHDRSERSESVGRHFGRPFRARKGQVHSSHQGMTLCLRILT
jgi:hypothetical protein